MRFFFVISRNCRKFAYRNKTSKMTRKQYISRLTSQEKELYGKDIPQKSAASVIDGLCDVIAKKNAAIANKDTLIADKDTVLAERDKQIAELQHQIAQFQRMLFGHKSEKLHPEDPGQLTLDFGEEKVEPLTTEELKDAESLVNSKIDDISGDATQRRTRDRKRASRRGKEYRISDDIPRDEPTLFYPEGFNEETMEVIGWNTHEYLEIEQARLHVRVEKEAICKLRRSDPADFSTVIMEGRGQNCLPGSKAGNSLMAKIVTDKFCYHLPEYRQAKRFEDMGIQLPTSSINRWLHALADNLTPICDLQAKLIFSSQYQHLDETVIRINDQKHKTRKGYMWSDVDGMAQYGLVFFYDKGSRGGKVIRPKLLERKASLHTDGYVVYKNIERDKLDDIKILYCMAHARRKFEAIKEVPEAAKILYFISVLYTLEANLKEQKASADEIRRQRQEKAVPILECIKKHLDTYVTVDTPSSALTKACQYAIERWDGLCRYCEEGYYDIDNNPVERSIRPLTLGRKNWLFVDDDTSAEDTAIYMTLCGSCNLLGITPYEYFMDILPKLRIGMSREEAEELLPYKVAQRLRNA